MIGTSEIILIFGIVIFWIPVILLIYLSIRDLINRSKKVHEEKTALNIVKERYAKGEITKEEFEEIKKTLDSA
ncbi:SHOCT domain-containing protein [Methanosarcina sp.]|uniref:SHOCT domain-containing protein n=1 Tax=Methanosarcina sp. TaxID=2213 RepID=UPI0029895482|nr:SHOCT domain-containing protein [Methanosarcina sp.]MDW5549884.1 SHOCT domain-containing protein [Methanosarcina sp.]MDW5552488.1 SHOCT domain-containing protein [Methanosarcina sp.]MDW5560218.1 SHOCT domain-containing protein [Methanosarcina sp.]